MAPKSHAAPPRYKSWIIANNMNPPAGEVKGQAMPLKRRARFLALRQLHFLAWLEKPQHRKTDAALQRRAGAAT
jgi:hypothetical protein